jgi:hypothetical protein
MAEKNELTDVTAKVVIYMACFSAAIISPRCSSTLLPEQLLRFSATDSVHIDRLHGSFARSGIICGKLAEPIFSDDIQIGLA